MEGVKILLLGATFRGAHARFRFEPERPQIGEQMPKDLELIARRPAIELEHDRGIERRDIAMPDVARDAGEENRGVTTFEAADHWHLGNGMALPVIFAKEERVDAGGVVAHDYVLIVVGKNLRLDEVAGAQEIGHGAGFAHGAESAFSKTLAAGGIFTLEFLAGE